MFILIKMHMLYNQNKSCVKLCKNIAFFKKKPLFFQKTHCFQTCALFYPIFLKRKIITGRNILSQKKSVLVCLNKITLHFGSAFTTEHTTCTALNGFDKGLSSFHKSS